MTNLRSISSVTHLGTPASYDEISRLHAVFDTELPGAYIAMLQIANGFTCQTGLVIYSMDDLLERNETFEVRTYAKNYLAIGDDSGGRLVMLHSQLPGVWIVDSGSLDPDDMVLLATSLDQWIEDGVPLEPLVSS